MFETGKSYDTSRETLIRLLKASETRCVQIREHLEKDAEYTESAACAIREIDDALYQMCLDSHLLKDEE